MLYFINYDQLRNHAFRLWQRRVRREGERGGRFYESKEFEDLNRVWNARLKAEGLGELEDSFGRMKPNHRAADDNKRVTGIDAAQRARYFELANRWLNLKVWKSRADKRLWELHCEGVSLRKSTIRMWPMVWNQKSKNEVRLAEARAEMYQWAGSDVLKADNEVDKDDSLWAQAMEAEGWNPDGYLMESEGTENLDFLQPGARLAGEGVGSNPGLKRRARILGQDAAKAAG